MGRFLVLTDVEHVFHDGAFYAYGPYIKEMNLWSKYYDSVFVLAPLSAAGVSPKPIDIKLEGNHIKFVTIPALNFSNPIATVRSFFSAFYIFFIIVLNFFKAEVIHFRCPSHTAFLGLLALIFFRNKKAIAKYAGNWDPASNQPLSYEIHRKLLNSVFLYPSLKVLVYGEFSHSSKNIIPFFTASYTESQTKSVEKSSLSNCIKLIYVGALFKEKRPETIIKVTKKLLNEGYQVQAVLCGDGPMKSKLEELIVNFELQANIQLLGNVTSEEVIRQFINSHFLIFISQSEGWPKVVAESMFWGCVPFTSKVSCVEQMVGDAGQRGFLIEGDDSQITEQIKFFTEHQEEFDKISKQGIIWSRYYTLERFDAALKKLNESIANN
ncbi:glycosyltransferase [Algoriphagus hitonicola]|uniref:Glycosyltransferase involved in cell wall bisynthesis n=1 Tax=Algoriphagus hitonicola TaxID=435880 RepID=A0A1I2X3T6_9BACT|nr:glycosyltransferase [Algoriphagus hitonicola]SFH08203.1 Glycosyltransferase involved in cell wall bisynthesis [Algoriphagus hitonicola]